MDRQDTVPYGIGGTVPDPNVMGLGVEFWWNRKTTGRPGHARQNHGPHGLPNPAGLLCFPFIFSRISMRGTKAMQTRMGFHGTQDYFLELHFCEDRWVRTRVFSWSDGRLARLSREFLYERAQTSMVRRGFFGYESQHDRADFATILLLVLTTRAIGDHPGLQGKH
jgi:hypothetical protein